MATKIAYIVSRFPHLPETFILREMEELERYGWEVALYPLILQKQPVVHPEAQHWVARARTASLFSPTTFGENWRRLLYQPGKMATLMIRIIAENMRSPNFLVRAVYLFPKAVTIAGMMLKIVPFLVWYLAYAPRVECLYLGPCRLRGAATQHIEFGVTDHAIGQAHEHVHRDDEPHVA